ncbi:MAG: hypothetical protein ACP5GX_04455 [Anaerolineae bacterium]
MSIKPTGEERAIKRRAGATVDGAPISYVIALAAVVAVLAFVPLSIVIGSGKSFPMSQAVYPLVGWILGPVAGALADGVGALVGVLIAPHTTTIPAATVFGAVMAGLAAGCMNGEGRRGWWWLPLSILLFVVYGLYVGRAVFRNGVAWWAALLGSIIDGSALLLFVLPTRLLIARWLASENAGLRAVGLFLGTWVGAGISHLCAAVIVYYVFNWPQAVWLTIAPLAPLEHALRSLVGAVIGSGVIAGLGATGLLRPEHARY